VLEDESGTILEANEALCRTFGYAQEELIGNNICIVVPPDHREDVKSHIQHLMNGGVLEHEVDNTAKDGTVHRMELRETTVPLADGRTGILVVANDITGRKRAEEENKILKLSIDLHFDGAYWHDSNNRFVYVNEAGCRALGYSREELIGKSLGEINPRATPERLNQVWDKLRRERVFFTESVHRRKDGSEFPVEVVATYVRYDGREYTCGFARDITERRQVDERLRTSLREKETMLKEIHHRVKNNLQVISSLLSLQSNHVKDHESLALFRETQNRVRSMAMIHEKLYQSNDLARIDFADYVESLTGHLSRSYVVDPQIVSLSINVDRILMSVDKAVSCGLIINELVTNSLKHAFPQGRSGHIVVALRSGDGSHLSLNVSDDGIGLPQGFDIRATKSLGLQLVSSLTEQLDGTLVVRSDRGTEFTISFQN
jgi:PAS domain S-box-containing protein